MQSDTRDSSSARKVETFASLPPSANSLPEGSGQNTAGSHSEPLTLKDAVKTVRFQDFTQVHMYPCVRESFLIGIAGAFGTGSIRAIFGAQIPKATNWAVGTFILVSWGNYELCNYKRTVEKAQMKRVVEVMDLKKAKKMEKENELDKKREERRRKKEEDDMKLEEAKRWGGWKFW
ncbi:hypothetical protein BJ878DRAFT_85659 [Calycina marina]|uniref:Cytochrome c oxidase assembly protein COX20, mitochondrial n=1 Tax=Calycina marina TaxID=1763456 RepID=A0A9P7Z3B7_9HELO|nr:hypothetical protein BJ878DRAFT_85659 [Calycina marina]